MLQKPPHGTPCNGCGQCCMSSRCPLGAALFGPGSDCPALEVKLPGFACGLVENPGRYAMDIVFKHGEATVSQAATYLIGAGVGCDALIEGESPNLAWREAYQRFADFDKAKAAARIWDL